MKKQWLSLLMPAAVVAGLLITARPGNAQFVKKSGSDLTVNGAKIKLFGGSLYPTVWQGQYLGEDSFTNSDPAVVQKLDAYMAAELTNAQTNRLNCVRVVNFLRSSTDYGNATCWNHIDKLITNAASKRIYVILDLSTFRNRLESEHKDPYDPNLWTGITSFVANRYRNNSTVAMYSIAGEVPAPNYGPQYPGASQPSAAKLLTFFDKVSTQLWNVDKNHLISSGGFIFMDDPNNGIPWQQIYALPHIGLATIHAYGSDSAGNQVVPVAAYTSVGAWANGRGIPFLVEEFGAPQSMGDANRSNFFGQQYTQCARYVAAAQLFWNFGLEVTGGSFDVNANTPQTLNTVKGWAN